ncbi:MAG: endo-1,4-beta-xylanase, partial [Lachnospiraceae bacterium]|nr:endo-1,4-beta-xylanase [Lachnospiraceae bacterium]
MQSTKKKAVLRRTIALLLALFMFSTPALSFLGDGALLVHAEEGMSVDLADNLDGDSLGDPGDGLPQDYDCLGEGCVNCEDSTGSDITNPDNDDLDNDGCQNEDCLDEDCLGDCLLDGIMMLGAFSPFSQSGNVIYDMATDPDLANMATDSAWTDVLQKSDNPTITIENGTELHLTGRSASHCAVDIKIAGLNIKAEYDYTFTVTGQTSNGTTVSLNGAEDPWSWYANQTVDSSGEFLLTKTWSYEELTSLAKNPSGAQEQIRIQTQNGSTVDFEIHTIVVTESGGPSGGGVNCVEIDINTLVGDNSTLAAAVNGVREFTLTNGHEWASIRFNADLGANLEEFASVTLDFKGVDGDVTGDRLRLFAMPTSFTNSQLGPGFDHDIQAPGPANGGETQLLAYSGWVPGVGTAGTLTINLSGSGANDAPVAALGAFASQSNMRFGLRLHKGAGGKFEVSNIKFNAIDCNGDCTTCGGSGGTGDNIVIDFEDQAIGDLVSPFRVNGGSTEAEIYDDGGNKVLRFQPNTGNNSGVIIPVTIPSGMTLGDYEKITYRIKASTAVGGKMTDFFAATRGYGFQTWLEHTDNGARKIGGNSGSINTSWSTLEFNINPALSSLSGNIDIMAGIHFLGSPEDEIYYYLDDITFIKRNTINYTVAANGQAGLVTTTEITLTFTDPVVNLLASEIEFTPGGGNTSLSIDALEAVTGSDNKVWKLSLSDDVEAAENVKLKINRLGIQDEEKTILIHRKLTETMDNIVITFAPDTASWNARFRTNGNGVDIEIDDTFGREDNYSLKVTRLSNAMTGWNHWVRFGHIAQHATPGTGDVQLNLPAGAVYTITAHFYVPAAAAGAKTISGPQMFLNNQNSGSNIFPSNAGNIPTNTWVELKFVTPVMAVPLDSISFRLNANDDSTYPDYWYIDDVSISQELAELPEWDLTLDSLAQTYDGYFLFGNIMNVGFGDSMDADTRAMFEHHYNAVTAENCMKPDSWAMTSLTSSPNFSSAWTLINWASGKNISVIGHALVWHQQSYRWLNENRTGTDTYDGPLTRAEARDNLETFINLIAGEFAGTLDAWDVVNEAFADGGVFDGDWRNNLRTSSNWYRSYDNGANRSIGESGADYIYDAFVFAREADDDATLYYNDYNEEFVTKSAAIADMVKKLNWKWRTDPRNPEHVAVAANYTGRALIEGIGMQAHYNVNTSISAVEAAIRLFIEAGAEVSVTELDITSVTQPTATNLQHQANQYAGLFQIYKKYSNWIERVTVWGREDGMSWRGDRHPLLFDGTFKPKPAYFAVIDPDGWLGNSLAPLDDPLWPPALTDPGPDPELPDLDLGPKKASAMQGTPTLGAADPLWDTAPEISIDNMLFAPGSRPEVGRIDTSGKARILWDNQNLYVRVEVSDDMICFAAGNDWEKDSVEVFVSETNFRGDYAQAQVGNQYRVTIPTAASGVGSQGRISARFANTLLGANWPTTAVAAPLDNDYAFSALTNDGYVVYMRIPFRGSFAGEAGKVIGLDIQINDSPPATDQRAQITWSDPLAGAYSSSTMWGEVTLVASKTSDTPQMPGSSPSPSPSPSPTPPPANFGDSPGSVPVWNELNNTINEVITNAINDTLVNNPANTLGANTVNNAAGNGFDLVVNTGTEIVVPAQIFETLQGTSSSVMMNTGAGVTFSISGGNIPAGFDAESINLSLKEEGMAAPPNKIAEATAGSVTSIEIPMESRESFGMVVGQHFNVGSENAGKFANLFRFNETIGEFEYLGSFEINEKGQAMFG